MKSLIEGVINIIVTIAIAILMFTAAVLAFGVFLEWWLFPLMEWAFAGEPFPFF